MKDEDDIIEVRKTTNYNRRNIARSKLEISVDPKSGGIYFYSNTCEMLGLNIGDAVMFSFNKTQQIAYIYKEKLAHDNYIIKKQNNYVLRINNKDIINLIVKFFQLSQARSYLNVDPFPDDKNRYKITLN